MSEEAVTLAAVGDVVLSRDDPAAAFDHVRAELSTADLRTANLEVPLSAEGMPQYAKRVNLHASPAMIDGYLAAGFDVVSLANNHTMDYGVAGLRATLRLLDEHGLAYVGAGEDRDAAWGHHVVEVRGLRVAFVSFASVAHGGYGATAFRPGIAMIRRDPLFGEGAVAPDDVEAMRASLLRARAEADLVVAFFHWGMSQSTALSVSQRHLARQAVDAGAHAVVGHHPHVLQGVEVIDGAPVLYSLGNFVFDLQPSFFDEATGRAAIARLRCAAGGVERVELVPTVLDEDAAPRVPSAGDAAHEEVLAAVEELSAELGTRVDREAGVAVVAVGTSPSLAGLA